MEYTGATWDGFTIRHGFYTDYKANRDGGAGVRMFRGVTLQNCVVTENYNSSSCTRGAGIYCDGENSKVVNCFILNNRNVGGESYGGGMYMILGTGYNNLVANNYAQSQGGGIFIEAATFYNNTIAYNQSNGTGGIHQYFSDSYGSANLRMYNCLLYGNQNAALGFVDVNKFIGAYNCYVQSSTGLGTNITGKLHDSYFGANASANPFERGDQAQTENNFRLNATTACVNNGTENLGKGIFLPETDVDFTARVKDCTVDIGAYERSNEDNVKPDNNGVYYVTQNGAGTSDGSSLANAACAMKLQEVLNAAGERTKTGQNAVVKLAGYEGQSFTYHANTLSDPKDPQSYTYVIPYGVTVMGGYNEQDAASWNDDSRNAAQYMTVLSAVKKATSTTQAVNGYHVVTFGEKPEDWAGEDRKTLLDGVYLEEGLATSMAGEGNPNTRGGGAIVPAWAHVRNCVVRHCEALQGGGLYLLPGATVSGCGVMQNKAEEGAGIYADATGVTLANRAHLVSSTVTDNTATNIGGGLYMQDGAVMVNNTVLWGNTAPSDKDISGVVTTTFQDNVLAQVVEQKITDFYPANHSFVENYEMPSNFENSEMESDEDIYFANDYRLLKAYSPLIKHGMDVTYQQKFEELLDVATTDMQGIVRKEGNARIDAGAYAFEGGVIPTDILLKRIFVSQGANVQLPKDADINDYIGRSFYTSLTWLDDALEYIKAVRQNGTTTANTQFEILLAGGIYKPSHRRTDATSEGIDQRQNSYVIPQGVHIYGGFKGNELISSKAENEGDLTEIPGVSGTLECMGDIKTILDKRESSDFNQNGIFEPWELADQTILSGHVNMSETVKNVYHVLYSDTGTGAGTVNPVVLDGLTVMEGETLSELSATGQDEIGRGGGLYTAGVPFVIHRCRFINNFAVRGGAIYARDASVSIIGSILAGNGTVDGYNGAEARGGAVYLSGFQQESSLKAVNTLWVNNETRGDGGAIATNQTGEYASQTVAVDLMNNTLVRNMAEQSHAAMYVQPANSKLTNTLLWGNEGNGLLPKDVDVSYCASDVQLTGTANIILSKDNMAVSGPRFTKPSETAGVAGNNAANLWNPVAISVLTDAGNGVNPLQSGGGISGAYKDWWSTNQELEDYKDHYMKKSDGNDYLRYAGPLDTNGAEADKPIDIGLYEYQYERLFPKMDAIYVATQESGRADGSDWANATSDLRGAIMAMANPAGSQQTPPQKNKAVYIKAGEYSMPRLSAGTAYTLAMSANMEHGTSLTVRGSFNASGVQDYSQPTVITTHEQSQNTTDKLISVNTGAKPVTIDGLTFINKRANGGIGMEAVTEAGGKLTLTHTAFRMNDGGAMTLKNDGETLIANALFADSKGTGLTVTNNVGNVTVVNATFANNDTDMTKELTKVYNTVSWRNTTQNLTTTEGQNNANIANGIKNDDIQQGPNFVDPANADVLQCDYNIYPSLTLLNKGNNNNYTTNVGVATMDNEKDLGGHARQVETIDIGAYEYTARLQPVVYVKDNVVGSNGSGDSWANAIAGQSLQGAVNLAGIYAADKENETGTVFVHGNVKNSTTLTLSMARTKVYGSMNDETGANAREILGKRQGILTTDNRSTLEGGLTLTAGATGSVVDGFEVSGTVNIDAGMLATSIVKNDIAATGDGMLYNSLVDGNVSGKAVNVTATDEISEGGNNRASVSETNSYVTDNYWNYQLMETSADIDPTGTRTDINDYIKQVGHNRDLAGNLRIRNTVDNGCFETWNISSDYIITADDYPVGKSVVYVRSGKELGIEKASDGTLVYPNGNAFNPGFLLLEHQAGLRGNGNYISLTNFAVERNVPGNGSDLANIPFTVSKKEETDDVITYQIYNGKTRARYDYKFDSNDSKAWENLTNVTGKQALALNNSGTDEVKVRFYGNSYEENGKDKDVELTKWNFNDSWTTDNPGTGNRFTHKENMSWNLFGSPYLCAMNYSDLQYGRVIYGYNGSYQTVKTYGDDGTTTGHIPAGSAVFTQTATLKDAEIFTVVQPTGFKNGKAFENMSALNLAISPVGSTRTTDDEETVADVLQLNAVESSEARTDFDMGADGVKWMAEDRPQIYAEQNGGRYSLLSAVDKEGSVQIGLSVPQTGMYSLYIPADCDAYDYETVVLEDKQTGTLTDLKAGSYTFNAPQAGDLNDRFQLYFNRSVDEAESNIRVVSTTAGQARVLGIQPGDVIRVYNTQGMLVEQRKADATEATFSLPRGIHLFKVTTANGDVVKKTAVR